MGNMTWLLEKKPRYELEVKGDTIRVVLSFANFALETFSFSSIFSSS